MIKPNLQKILITLLFIPLLGSSCKKKADNFDIDLSNLKIPQKSTLKISEQDNSDSSQTKIVGFESKLLPYKEKSEVLNSVKIGKKDPFSQESEINKFSSVFKLTGFLDAGKEKYVFVIYQNNGGTITEESVGGLNSNLLPIGAKVVDIDTQNMKLTINFDNKDYIFKL